MKSILPLVLTTLLACTGCATYRVQVEAIREPAAPVNARAYVLEIDPAVSRGPQFAPALRCLRAALAHRGFAEAGRREEAALVVSFGYSVTPAGVEVTHSTRSVEVTRMPSPPPVASRRIEPPPPTRDVLLLQNREPRYRVVMSIEAREAGTDRSAWRVEASSLIGPNDRNAILPCLIAAVEPMLDPAMNSAVEVAVGQASSEVRALRSGS